MDLHLNGKTALITGASGGLGGAIAMEFARERMALMLVARDAAALERLAARATEIGAPRVACHPCDLTRSEAPEAAVAAAADALGGIDVLVNCAGATRRGDFFTLDDRDFHDGFELKFHGTVRMCRAAWAQLKARHGAVVNVVGVGANTPSPDFVIGSSVNAALLGFTKALAEIGLRDGVRVNALSPGYIRTERLDHRIREMAAHAGQSPAEAEARLRTQLAVPRFGAPEEVGRLAAFLASDQAAYIHGATVNIDGGATKGL